MPRILLERAEREDLLLYECDQAIALYRFICILSFIIMVVGAVIL
jgi:hypothetical protein